MTITLNGTTGVTTPNLASTGTVTGSTFNGASTFGFKNRLINGAMKIAQRTTAGTSGSSAPTTTPTYPSVDRFYVYATGATVTASQTTSSAVNYLSIAGAASVTAVGVGQRIEANNCIDLAGTTATLSLNISNSLLTTVTWTASYATSADTWSAKTQIATGTFTVTSTLTNYSTSISIPSAATTGIEILLTVGAQTSGTWVMNNIQLEPGAIATSFDYRPYGTELALCQRYFQKSYDQANALATATTTGEVRWQAASTGGESAPTVMLPVVMRTAPTLTLYSAATGASGNVRNYSTGADVAMVGANVVGSRGWSGGSTAFSATSVVGYQFAATSEL